MHDYHLLLRLHTSLQCFYYYTYGGFGKIVERRDNIWAAGRDKNDSVAAIYSHLDSKVWGTFPWKFKSLDVQKGPF